MNPATEQNEPAVSPSTLLREKIAAVRRKHLAVSTGTGAAMALGAFLVLLGITMLLDWWLDFPLWARAVLLAWIAGTAGYVVWQYILTPLRRQPDDDAVALTVEKARPQFRSRLISAIQFSRPGAVPPGAAISLVRMTIRETEEIARPMEFTEVISTERLQKAAWWSVGIVAVALFLFMYGGQASRDLLKRAFLSTTPVPRHTRVIVLTQDGRVGRGDTVRIEALAHGVVPKSGNLLVKASGRRTLEYPMDRDKEGRFVRTLENIQDTFTYTVKLNDGMSETRRIEVVPRPTTASIECEQVFPAYTKLPSAKRPLGDLTLLAGSQLKISAVSTRDLKGAVIHLAGLSNDIPMQLDPKNPRAIQAEFTIPPKGLNGFSIHMVDTDDMDSRDAAVYRIDVLPDRVPRVRINYPDRREELVTRQAVQPIAFEATDDFEISKARLRYRVGESEEAAIQTVDLELGTNVVKQMRNVFEWSMRDFQPPLVEGTRIEFWVEVEDNNNVTGPGLGQTEHQLLRVVSESEKRADLLNRAGDFLGTISDVTGDQEKLNANLGALILEKRR